MKQEIEEQFMELPDEIPFKKIQAFKVYDVQQLKQEDKFQLHIYKKCTDLPDEKDGYKIIRKTNDFQWIKNRISKESPSNLIIPALPGNNGGYYWDRLKNLTTKFYKNSKAQIRKGQENKYKCKAFKRFLQIFSDVSLKNLYQRPGFVESSLFTFLDQRYSMYKTEAFQKSQQTFTEKISTTLSSSGKLLTQLVGMWKKKQSKYSLQESIDNLHAIEEEFGAFLVQLQKYEHSLADLCSNFLTEKQNLENKDLQVYHILCRSEYVLKLLNMIKLEIQSVIARIQSTDHGLQQKQIRVQVEKYITFINNDQNYLRKQLVNILKQFYRISINVPVQLTLNDIYPIK